ncbi:hypothetical protein CCC_01794 [Paramagnetospirillum magnetotacticum MS-1]|uniref:Uncharacterized protein n=1 Tax=Paramagnetospirillum magnetotacticum MS-1 TaxID=272627 RepID=A0A0C2UW10_PARME|nr:hypothetical protein CCC_01794 [Paramagnetospirillum magnetotacticum MS-1]
MEVNNSGRWYNFIVLAGLVPAIHVYPSGKMRVERRGYAGRARA